MCRCRARRRWRLPMARGLNGSANGSGGHVPTGREAVEARLPGVSNLPPAVAGALPAVVGLRTTVPKDRRSAQTLGTEREGHGVLIGDDGLSSPSATLLWRPTPSPSPTS